MFALESLPPPALFSFVLDCTKNKGGGGTLATAPLAALILLREISCKKKKRKYTAGVFARRCVQTLPTDVSEQHSILTTCTHPHTENAVSGNLESVMFLPKREEKLACLAGRHPNISL